MKINKNELRVLVDVDDTLITKNTKGFSINYYGHQIKHKVLKSNIALLKSYKARGYEVIVHSANGWQWAERVVRELNLERFVDEVCTKNIKYVDDRAADEWSQRVFVED